MAIILLTHASEENAEVWLLVLRGSISGYHNRAISDCYIRSKEAEAPNRSRMAIISRHLLEYNRSEVLLDLLAIN